MVLVNASQARTFGVTLIPANLLWANSIWTRTTRSRAFWEDLCPARRILAGL